MKTVLILPVLAAAAVPVAAQDTIVWTDGTVASDVKVTAFTLREIAFATKAGAKTRPADQVAELEVDRVRAAYERGFARGSASDAPAAFLDDARKLIKKDPFLAQFGFERAARALLADSLASDAFVALTEMAKELPDAGFVPELYRRQLEHHLSRGEAGAASARAVAADYLQATSARGFTDGHRREAECFDAISQVAAGPQDAAGAQRRLRDIVSKNEGAHPGVANRARLQLAHTLRQARQLDESRRVYQDLLERGGLWPSTRAQALLGRGHVHLLQAADKPAFKAALLDFLRVYVELPDAGNELVAEALYHAKQAVEKWDGEDAPAMARKLDGILKRNPRYAGSAWAKR